MKRYSKGQPGYRDYHKKKELLKVLIGAALIVIQLIFRKFADSTALKNTLTVMAILSVLPAANIAAPLLASFKYRSISSMLEKKASAYEEKGVLLYDLIISSKEQLLPMDVILVKPDEIYAYCTAGKSDSDKAEQYIKQMLSQHKLDYNVKVIFDENSFFKRLSSLKPKEKKEDNDRSDQAVSLLKSLSM
ncbi:O-linked GlcNAc transferase-like protein [Lacrimispora sp. 38-1]|uniref:O-linked GlcNAc transferase-like protein n=1 Tax=Lacrimispora sp. 38-1 TaxID=3125778 RepID=UPI003CF02916